MASSANEDTEQDQNEREEADKTVKSPPRGDMTLKRALEESQRAMDCFFNNEFVESCGLMTPYATTSFYHALGDSIFLFLEAILTFEHKSIANASTALKQALEVCDRYRRKDTVLESLKKVVKIYSFHKFTEEEAHAELCHAECLLLQSMLAFMEDETLSSMIRAGYRIRSCFISYKNCEQILIKCNWSENSIKIHFESGVKLGIGTFNLLISLLPSRVIKLLEMIGFSGNQKLGLDNLMQGSRMNGLRQIVCVLALLGYHLIVLYVWSHQEGDIQLCEEILESQLKKYPRAVLFLFLKGRLEFMKCNPDESIEWYTKSWKSHQDVSIHFHHVCFWELMWVCCLKTDWKEALVYCSQLLENSKWSRTMYSYQKASLMIMLKDDVTIIDNLMKDVPKFKQIIAGKSLPFEKFAVKKAVRYFEQGHTLILPIIELMYLWNLFKAMKDLRVADAVYKTVEKALRDLDSKSKPTVYDNDNRALILLLRAACLRSMRNPLQAIECLETVISLQKDIIEDNYLVPYAIVELAHIEWERGNREKAILALEDARKNYSGYCLESRLHFRIHTALTEYKASLKLNTSFS